MIILNCCDVYADRVDAIMSWCHELQKVLALHDCPVFVIFRDYDPIYDGDYRGGFHDWGRDRSLVLIDVWDEEHMPMAAPRWLIAHELRHVFQSLYDVEFNDPEPTDIDEYREQHDYRNDERDSDAFASRVVPGFDYAAWWGLVLPDDDEDEDDEEE